MERNLKLFYDNINFESKDRAIYEDKKGNRAILNPLGLYCSVEYQEVEANEKNLKVLRFEGKIEENETPGTTIRTIQVDKSTVTGKEQDKLHLVDKDIDVYQLWTVKNGVGIEHVFLNKDDAVSLYEEIKKKVDDSQVN